MRYLVVKTAQLDASGNVTVSWGLIDVYTQQVVIKGLTQAQANAAANAANSSGVIIVQ